MIRKPKVHEAPQMKKIIDPFAQEGRMLPKSLHSIYTSIRDFWIIKGDDPEKVEGCCALQVSWNDLAEIRTLAVATEAQGKGYGSALVRKCMEEAVEIGVRDIFTLTYVPDFFRTLGFIEIEKNSLPNKIWADCIHCPYFPDCRETAMIYRIGD